VEVATRGGWYPWRLFFIFPVQTFSNSILIDRPGREVFGIDRNVSWNLSGVWMEKSEI
jgi:hypothetical protein